ncbi:hypothetical protein TWF281_007401 [Arthrobotrys megalospora]
MAAAVITSQNEYQSDFIRDNPTVADPVIQLLKIQSKFLSLDIKYQQELWDLERKHFQKCQELFDSRASILNGEVISPPGALSYAAAAGATLFDAVPRGPQRNQQQPKASTNSDAVGLPHFWLQAMKNNPLIGDWVDEKDEPALSYLKDIRIVHFEGNQPDLDPTADSGNFEVTHPPADSNTCGFKLVFDFKPNPFFTNESLTKEFLYEREMNGDDIYCDLKYLKATGCKIAWKEGKDLTAMVFGSIESPDDLDFQSFFDFFGTTSWEDEEEEEDDEEEDEEEGEEGEQGDDADESNSDEGDDDDSDDPLDWDFELGEEFKDKFIPYAIHWYTGEARFFEDDFSEDEANEGDGDGESA